MGRYLKYLEIVNKIDDAIEKKAAGRVDIDKDLPKIKNMLEVQKLALEMSMCIDRIDDNVKSSFRLYAKGDPSARGVVEEVLEKLHDARGGAGGESASGRDFRRGREDPPSDRGYPAGPWTAQGRADARAEMNRYEDEESRRGRRSRSGMDDWENEERHGGERSLFDHVNEEDRRGRGRSGRFVHRAGDSEEPRDFWPLTFPMPFGMMGWRRGADDEQSRMGFFERDGHPYAPYSHMPDPEPSKDMPLIKRQGAPTGQAAIEGAAPARGQAGSTGAATVAK